MLRSWKLGRVAGIDLFLHPSALLWFLLASHTMPTVLESMAVVVALLGSIVLHEYGHALMARRYGIGTADITLYLFGGVARLERMPRTAGPELLITLAGPSVNLAIATGLGLVAGLGLLSGFSSPLVWQILGMNLFLAVFNLLPVFPMDGGRILRALLSGWLGRLRATEVALTFGRVLAVVGGVFFLASGMWQAVVLVIFVYYAGGRELAQVRLEHPSSGFLDVPTPPAGYRWADRGDGVWRLAPILVSPHMSRDRSWS